MVFFGRRRAVRLSVIVPVYNERDIVLETLRRVLASPVPKQAIVVDDGGIIPVHFQVTTWAARKGITYIPRTDERTYAHGFKPQ